MIKVKHFTEPVENDDGERIWVEPIGIVPELRDLCQVRHVLSHLGPPRDLWEWFEEHPDGYDYFRACYHEHLSRGPHRDALLKLARTARNGNFTLLHQGDDPNQNTAAALHDFLTELSAYCPQDE